MIRALDLWLPGYLAKPRWLKPPGITDVVFAICDHFEPQHDSDSAGALHRIARWSAEYPALISGFKDAGGFSPRHTFFFPVEQYNAEMLEALATLCRETGSELELHLHHSGDTADSLRAKLERGVAALAKHGALPKDPSGKLRYGFIHGNWALAHSHPAGRHCGVPDELAVLAATGCYADFTMPSAPDRTQTKTVNRIYYASSNGRPKPHDRGTPAQAKRSESDASRGELLLVQGPLGLNWSRRKWGILPRLENGEISGANPPRGDRLKLWLEAGVTVEGQPDWIFIKLHTHGGIPSNMKTLLGPSMPSFYRHLLEHYCEARGFRVHFATAREMVNMIHAAEDGHTGNAGYFRDYRYRLRNPPAEPRQ
jgi:hypothetical protein